MATFKTAFYCSPAMSKIGKFLKKALLWHGIKIFTEVFKR